MRLLKIIFAVFIFVFVCNFMNISAQRTPPQQIKILNNYGHIPFEDGKTTIAEVKFIGFDSDYEQYDEVIGKKIPRSEFLREITQAKAAINPADKFSGAKVAKTVKLLKNWILEKGYLNAEVVAFGEELPKNQMKLIFSVKRGNPAFVSEIRFDGNINVSSEELVKNFKECLGDRKLFDARAYDYFAHKCSRILLFSKGFFKAEIQSITPRLVSGSYIVEISIEEGIRFVYGTVKIKGAKVFTQKEILETLGIHSGDIANGEKLQTFFGLELKKMYLDKGFIKYNAYIDSEYIEPLAEGLDGTVNLTVDIDEGRSFEVRKIKFEGVEKEEKQMLKEQFSLKENQVYNYTQLQKGIEEINELKKYIPIEYSLGINTETWSGITFQPDYEKSEMNIIISLIKLQ